MKLTLTPQFSWSNKRCALLAVILSFPMKLGLFTRKWHWLCKKYFRLIFYPLPLAPLFPLWMPTPTRSTHKQKDPKTRVLSRAVFWRFLFCIDHEIHWSGIRSQWRGCHVLWRLGRGRHGWYLAPRAWAVGAVWARLNMVWAPLGAF
jgi:hypothetical protein